MTINKYLQKIKKNKHLFLLILLLILAFLLRIFGLNWDKNNHLHPDERFLTMVSADIKLPQNIFQYFNTQNSPLNPKNSNYTFYAYGTFPLLVTRGIAEILKLTSYDQIFLVGRVLSAIFDSLTVLLIFLISLKIFKKKDIAIYGAFLYSICILPIQQSHFFTVDSFTVFFFTLTILLTISDKYLFSGLIFGLTLANKTSIGIVLPVLLFFNFIKNKKFIDGIFKCCLFLFFTLVAFRIFQPYAFDGFIKLSPNFISSVKEASQMITGEINYPPNVQWKNTIPIVHPLLNLFFVGLGPITFLLWIFGSIKIFKKHQLIKEPKILILFLIGLTIFLYFSLQLAKYMRYFYPIYPIIAVFAGYGFSCLNRKLFILILSINIIITMAFLNIYVHPHSRYQASEWICQNASINSVLSSEIWDDSLPLNSPSCINKSYLHQDLSFFDTESSLKWGKINNQLKSVDFLILTSNRLWGSIPKDSDYHTTSVFYKNLFDGNSNFKLIKRIYSYPGFSLPFINRCILIGPSVYPYNTTKNTFFEIDNYCDSPGIYFRDDAVEESFTVYDHPQVNIFGKVN